MARLVPSNCILRPCQIQDLRRLAWLDRQFTHRHRPDSTRRWRNFAALAFLGFSIFVALKDLRLLAMIMLGFAPIYLIFAWIGWVTRHPPSQDWVDYWVIESDQDLVACAKWRHYDSYSHLVNLYVEPRWRKQGLGASLVERLLGQTTQPIYVISDHTSVGFFRRFGFQPIDWDDLPGNFPIPEFAIPGLDDDDRAHQTPLKYVPIPLLSERFGDFWEEVRQKLASLTLDDIEESKGTRGQEAFTLGEE
jgi:GNAT superfamily N-acetyltransferase